MAHELFVVPEGLRGTARAVLTGCAVSSRRGDTARIVAAAKVAVFQLLTSDWDLRMEVVSETAVAREERRTPKRRGMRGSLYLFVGTREVPVRLDLETEVTERGAQLLLELGALHNAFARCSYSEPLSAYVYRDFRHNMLFQLTVDRFQLLEATMVLCAHAMVVGVPPEWGQMGFQAGVLRCVQLLQSLLTRAVLLPVARDRVEELMRAVLWDWRFEWFAPPNYISADGRGGGWPELGPIFTIKGT